MARVVPVLAVLAVVMAIGCKDKRDDDGKNPPTPGTEAEDTSFAEDGTDSSAADTDVQLVTSSLVTTGPGDVSLATDLPAYVMPRCVTATGTPGERTYTFDNCQGRNGLRDLTGVIVARATGDGANLTLNLTFDDLKVNGATVDGSATAIIDADGVDRSMTWKATLDGTTAGGKAFSRQSDHTVSWKLGEPCFAVEGSATGSVRDRGIKTEITGFRRCGRGCPDAGGKITVTNLAKNKQVSLEYDGTNRATFTGPNGNVSTVLLFCRP